MTRVLLALIWTGLWSVALNLGLAVRLSGVVAVTLGMLLAADAALVGGGRLGR